MDCSPAIAVDCGDFILNGTNVKPSSTTVGSVIELQCATEGFVPSSNVVCGEDGRWIPDPSKVVCRRVTSTTTTTTKTTTTTGIVCFVLIVHMQNTAVLSLVYAYIFGDRE